jgi:hypothetical protein
MTTLTKTLIKYGLPDYTEALAEALKAGWELDASNPPTVIGFTFTCPLKRDDGIEDPVKLSRAEILRKAREAKAAKAAGAPEDASEGVAQ